MIDLATVIGSLDVGLLLAFPLIGLGRLSATQRGYLGLNSVGADLSCRVSALSGVVPFVVLEATWCAAAIAGMLRRATIIATRR